MGFYDDQVLPRFIDVALGHSMDPTRALVAAPLEGEVLEVGFGSGRNLPPSRASGSRGRLRDRGRHPACRRGTAPVSIR